MTYLDSKSSYSFFFSFWPLTTVFFMFLNDHFFKYAYPGLLTGKLSDFLGLFYFPLLLCVLTLLFGRLVLRKNISLTKRILIASILIADVIFIAAKSTVWGNEAVVGFLNIFITSRLVQDPWDITALIMNLGTYFYAKRFITQ